VPGRSRHAPDAQKNHLMGMQKYIVGRACPAQSGSRRTETDRAPGAPDALEA